MMSRTWNYCCAMARILVEALMAAVLVDLTEVGPLGKGWSFLWVFNLWVTGFPNFANVKLTIVFIDGWFIFSYFQSFSDFLL